MYVKNRSRVKRIAVDILGGLCIVGAGLTGWLPGPGGIPLLILGLSLLATNHEWAERLLLYIKDHGGKLSQKLFDGSPRTKLLIDVGGIAVIAAGVYILMHFTRSTARTAAISVLAIGIVLIAANRRRYSSLLRRLKQHS